MTDESAESQPLTEAATPGRSLRGAAEDLSTLFGEEALDPGRGATALGPQREPVPPSSARLISALEGMTQRISFLEKEMTGAVGSIQAVDRHLAATYQALQGLVERLPEDGAFVPGPTAAPVDLRPVLVRLESMEISLKAAVERLGSLERQARSAQSAPRSAASAAAGEAVAAVRRSLAEIRAEIRSDLRAELAVARTSSPPAVLPDTSAPLVDPPTADIDTLLASAPHGPRDDTPPLPDDAEPADSPPPAARYWSKDQATERRSEVPDPEIEPEPTAPAGGADPVGADPSGPVQTEEEAGSGEETHPDAAPRDEAVSFDRPPTPGTAAEAPDDEGPSERADARTPFWSIPKDSTS